MALEVQDCQWCGRRHAMACPRVRELEWDYAMGQQRLKRVVFWDLGPTTDPSVNAMFKYWGVQADGRSEGQEEPGGNVAAGNGERPSN